MNVELSFCHPLCKYTHDQQLESGLFPLLFLEVLEIRRAPNAFRIPISVGHSEGPFFHPMSPQGPRGVSVPPAPLLTDEVFASHAIEGHKTMAGYPPDNFMALGQLL